MPVCHHLLEQFSENLSSRMADFLFSMLSIAHRGHRSILRGYHVPLWTGLLCTAELLQSLHFRRLPYVSGFKTLRRFCVSRTALVLQFLFTDQKWLDLVPAE